MTPTPLFADRQVRETAGSLARLLLADARAGIELSTDVGLHLDLAVADLAFGEPERAAAELGRARELLGDRRPTPWLFGGGAAQLGWVSLQVAAQVERQASALQPWEGVVADAVAAFPAEHDVDLPFGLLGLGVYALAHPHRKVRAALVDGVLDVIAGRAEHDVDGMFVRLVDAPHRRQDGSACLVPLGVAHGIAGLVSFLASAAAAGLPCSGRANRLLSAAVRWLLRQRVPDEARWVRTGYQPHRLTWCYGDPGIALALSVVSRAIESATIAAAAAEITANALARPQAEAGVTDATLCHGAAGLIWFGHRVSLQTGDPAARRFTRTWVAHVAQQRAAGALRYVRPDGRARNHSLLEGDLGVALVLRYVATGAAQAWEQLLLGSRIEPPDDI